MKKQRIIRFYSFFLGCIYLAILLLLEFLGIGVFHYMRMLHKAGIPISCETLISTNGITFFRDVYLPLISNICGSFAIYLLLLRKNISGRVYWGIVALIASLLLVDSYVVSCGAFYYVMLGFPFHIYFLYVLTKRESPKGEYT